MASMENIIKEKTDEMVEKYRKGFADKGMQFDGLLETMFRQGISYGVTFAGMALVNAPYDITIGVNNNETKIS